MRLALILTLILTPSAGAVGSASCGKLARCIDYFQLQMCRAYGAPPAGLTPDQIAIGHLNTLADAQGCALPEFESYSAACEELAAVTFDEAEARDCAVLADESVR